MSYYDELQRALRAEKLLVSHGFGEGTQERGFFAMNKQTGAIEQIEKPVAAIVDAPVVHRDEMLDGVESPITGEIFYSKSRLLKHYADYGYVCTGGDHLRGRAIDDPANRPKLDARELRDDIERTLMDIKYDRIPIDEKSKQLNQEEERAWQSYLQRQQAR